MADAGFPSGTENHGRPKSNSEPVQVPSAGERSLTMNEIEQRLLNYKITDSDGFDSNGQDNISRRTPKLARNRRTKSLYGVSPNCKFGPCGTILDSSDTALYDRTCDLSPPDLDPSTGETSLHDSYRCDSAFWSLPKVSVLYTSVLIVVCWCLSCVGCSQYVLIVNSSEIKNGVEHFWRSTGFCPPLPHQEAYKFDASQDMTLNLALIGALPHQGTKQVRIHWLLDLVVVKELSNGNSLFDFSKLDDIIQLLWINGLRPGFELMGNPSNIFTNFENKTQVYLWRELVYAIAQNYISKYGIDEVKTWNFETWNEPDCRDFDRLQMSVQGFLNYYDACSEGLKIASPFLKFGGPGDGCDHKGHSKYADALLDHVVNGNNYFTGEKGVRINFLSYHRKGDGFSSKIFQDEIKLIRDIQTKYPSLAHKPFYNDEADPLVGWSKDEWWRADATYAAMVIKVIAQHQNMIMANSSSMFNYSLLSNDNAFLSYYPHQFTQRTLTARFQMNNTNSPYVNLVRKPVYSSMALLSLLGKKQVHVDFSLLHGTDFKTVSNGSDVGIVATAHTPDYQAVNTDSWQLSLLIYSSNDTFPSHKLDTVNYTLLLDTMNIQSDVVIVEYSIDNYIGNPYRIWSQYGRPAFPSLQQFNEMWKNEGPMCTKRTPLDIRKNVRLVRYSGSFMLNQPGVTMVHACTKSLFGPNQVQGVNIYNITIGQILITWSDDNVGTKCILRYDVEFSSSSKAGPYKKINNAIDSIVTAFVYAPLAGDLTDKLVQGYYRVRAVDYFNRTGPYSSPQKYPT